MDIQAKHVDIFRRVRRAFAPLTLVPKANNWRLRDDDDVWSLVVQQVIVVGGSAAADRFKDSAESRQRVAYSALARMSPAARRVAIHGVLRRVGCRYCSRGVDKCRKTRALCRNLSVLMSTAAGPTGLLAELSKIGGIDRERRRIEEITTRFDYVKTKGSRDFLMEVGLVRNAIALDTRVLNVLKAVGLTVPDTVAQSSSEYDMVEAELLEKLCKPLGLLGVEFDRLIYQNYDAISSFLRRLASGSNPGQGPTRKALWEWLGSAR
jgi:hypothetical protein